MEVLINNRQEDLEISKELKQNIIKAIETCIKVEKYNKDLEISISFVANDEIKYLNKEFRGINKITDVLSFPMDLDFIIEGENEILGDIIISTERAKEQALDYGHSVEREIIYLIIHSIFHLFGYDHMIENDKIEMRKKEKKTIKILGIYKSER